MKKTTVTRTWIGGLILLALGLIIAAASIGLLLAYGGTFNPPPSGNGYDFVPRYDSFFAMMVTLIVVGSIGVVVGGFTQLVAWIGALVNTYQLQEKTWFGVLLVGGLLGFVFGLVGFAVMVAYLIAGPDGMAVRKASDLPAAPLPSTLAPAS